MPYVCVHHNHAVPTKKPLPSFLGRGEEELTESLKLVDDVCSEHPFIVQMSVASVAVLDGATPNTLSGERVIPTKKSVLSPAQ